MLEQFSANLEELKKFHPFDNGSSTSVCSPLDSDGGTCGRFLHPLGNASNISSFFSRSTNKKSPLKTSPILEHAQAVVFSIPHCSYKEKLDRDDDSESKARMT